MAVGKTNNPLEKDLTPEEIRQMVNYNFQTDLFSQGFLKDISEEELKTYLSNPTTYKKKLEKYAMYQYITEGDVFAQFDLTRILPNLNYYIKPYKSTKNDEKKITDCRKCIDELNHKELSRDIISQLVSTGTVCGLIVGKETPKSKDDPYVVLFDDLEYIFPGRRLNGKWTVWIDLSYFTLQNNLDYKFDLLENLSPYVTSEDVENYIKNPSECRYIELPVERSICLRTHTLKRNQRFGIPWNTQSIYDIKHKQKLRNLEKNVANKVINSVAILTIGIKNSETSTYKKIGTKLARSTFATVKNGLNKSGDSEKCSIIGLPEFADLKWADTDPGDALDPEKITSINDDISAGLGVARGLITGKDTTYAVANLNLDIFFRKISEILENIEYEVYNKIIRLILPKTYANNYRFVYEKNMPLSNSERIQYLKHLADSGYSIRYVVEMLGLDFNEFINQSLFEIEDLDLRNKIKPPLTSYTATGDDLGGSDSNGDLKETTEKSKGSDDDNPKPSKK